MTYIKHEDLLNFLGDDKIIIIKDKRLSAIQPVENCLIVFYNAKHWVSGLIITKENLMAYKLKENTFDDNLIVNTDRICSIILKCKT